MFLNQITEGLRDPKDNPCWKGYHPVGTKKKNGRTVPNCVPESQENVKEGAYEDGVSDGIRGEPNRRASSIYGPSTGEYDRGYQVGLQKGKEQQQARLAQVQQDSAPYEKMSDEELIQLRKDIQQRSTERQKIYSKLRGADFSFNPKRHLPANDAELKAQHAKDNKAWHIINQVLHQRGVNIDKLGESEGSKFGSIYAEQLAQQTFDINPDLKDEKEVLNLGYSIAMRELGPRARGFFRDEDFPSDFVSAYGWLQDQKQGVAEAKADPTSTWVVYNGDRVKRFKTHQGAKAYAEQHGGKVASSAHYADKIQGKQGVAEAFIAPALSAANANAEHRRQGAAGGGYRGRIDIPVHSREDYISAGRALKKAAAAAGEKIEYGLSDGVMSVFSDSMDSDALDQFIDGVLGQGVAEMRNTDDPMDDMIEDYLDYLESVDMLDKSREEEKAQLIADLESGVTHSSEIEYALSGTKWDPLNSHGVNEVSDATLTSYLSKVDADSQKHEKDPTKRSAAKRNKSVAGFARAFNKLDSRKEKTDEAQYDRGDYYNAHQGGEYGKGLAASISDHGGGNYIDKGAMDGQRGRPKKASGFSNKLPADPFGRTTGKIPASAKPKKELDPFRDIDEGDRDPGALASRAHIASQERKHQAWDEKQKQLEKEFYANHPELDDRHKTVDNLVKEFSEMLSRTK